MTASPTRHPRRLLGSGLAAAVAVSAFALPAHADTTVRTFAELQKAFTRGDQKIVLGANITSRRGGSLAVPANTGISLDLAGFALRVYAPTDDTAAGIAVGPTSGLAIQDSSGGKGQANIVGGRNAAAIGGNGGDGVDGDAGAIAVTGGRVVATSNDLGAGIGGGLGGRGGYVVVTGGTVSATGEGGSAGIGAGGGGEGGTVLISGGNVTCIGGGGGGAGIGGSRVGLDGPVTGAGTVRISGGTVTSSGYAGGFGGAGIGGGNGGQGGSVTVSGGVVMATGGSGGAGVGGGTRGALRSVTIQGSADVTAAGTDGGAGVGGGYGASAGSVFITGGFLSSTGGANAAGIGTGSFLDGAAGGTVRISGGRTTATGGDGGAGIGGGSYSPGTDVTVTGDTTSVIAADGGSGASAVGAGQPDADVPASFGSLTNSGVLFIKGPDGLVIPSGATATNSYGVVLNSPLSGGGTLVNDGAVIEMGGTYVANRGTGSPTVSKNNYQLTLDTGGGTRMPGSPGTLAVYAPSVATGFQSLPTPNPPQGRTFQGWFTARTGGKRVTDTTDLPSTFGKAGPDAETLYAHYR